MSKIPNNLQWQTVNGLKINRGQPVLRMKATGNFTKDAIKAYIERINKKLKVGGRTGQIAVAIQYANKYWRGGYLTPIGEPVKYYEEYDEESHNFMISNITGFHLYLIKN